jgi:hypothetical protein
MAALSVNMAGKVQMTLVSGFNVGRATTHLEKPFFSRILLKIPSRFLALKDLGHVTFTTRYKIRLVYLLLLCLVVCAAIITTMVAMMSKRPTLKGARPLCNMRTRKCATALQRPLLPIIQHQLPRLQARIQVVH